MGSLYSLSADRNAQQQASHDVSYPEIFFRAVRVRIMTADTTLGDRYVRIQCFKVLNAIFRLHPFMWALRRHGNLQQSSFLKVGPRHIVFIDGPIADQPESNAIGIV